MGGGWVGGEDGGVGEGKGLRWLASRSAGKQPPQPRTTPHTSPTPQARIAAARYAHLPLSAIGADWVIDSADALYARQLRECPCLPACLPGWLVEPCVRPPPCCLSLTCLLCVSNTQTTPFPPPTLYPPSPPPPRCSGDGGHLLWAADPSQPDLASHPPDLAEALALGEQEGRLEVRGGGEGGGGCRWGGGMQTHSA